MFEIPFLDNIMTGCLRIWYKQQEQMSYRDICLLGFSAN